MGLLPRDPSRCARGCDGSRETTPLQRSACDNAEVSLSPVSVFASPGWQPRFRLIHLIALFLFLTGEKGHRGLGDALARDSNPDTGNVPDGLYEVVKIHGELPPHRQSGLKKHRPSGTDCLLFSDNSAFQTIGAL